jgi:hypothetical protein
MKQSNRRLHSFEAATYRQVPSFIEISVQCEAAVVAALNNAFHSYLARILRPLVTFAEQIFFLNYE